MPKPVAVYLRSSKDEKAVSNDSQYHELQQVAQRRGFEIVGRYEDAVESGKDWDRPGFQELIRAIHNPRRGWDTVLVKDTSRIARRRTLALIFEERECAQHGVEVVYASVPEGGDVATVMILRTLLQAMDEWHSITSREKGLAGMAQNVRNGYRAAGGAPYGYKLDRIPMGVVRNGAQVTKTRLALDVEADRVRAYLEARAAGVTRSHAARVAEIPLEPSSLVGIEWNALTYAGCTTFGVYQERVGSAYKGSRKRRARSEWQVQPDTHPALITLQQAEVILRALETSDHAKAVSQGRQGTSPYILSGLLWTPSGVAWEVSKRIHYWAPRPTGPARYLPLQTVERGVIDHVLTQLQTKEFAQALVDLTNNDQRDRNAEAKAIHKRIAELARLIDRAATLALELDDPAPYQRKIETMERERRELVEQHAALQEEIQIQAASRTLSLDQMLEILGEFAQTIEQADPLALKHALRSLVERIELDPTTLDCVVHFAVKNPLNMAHPWERHVCREYRRRVRFRLAYASQRGRWKRSP